MLERSCDREHPTNGGGMKTLFTILTALVLTVTVAGTALAGPVVTDLASPTHPDQWGPSFNNDPVFTWSAAQGLTGASSDPYYAQDLVVLDGRAYVISEYYGLYVLDVTQPSAPTTLGWCFSPYGGYSRDVDVAGSYAYVAQQYAGLEIISVSDPAAMSVVGLWNASTDVLGVDVAGTTAYVAAGEAGLKIVDVRDPAKPVLLGTCDTPGYAQAVQVVGSFAYVADGYGGLQVVSVKNAKRPALAGALVMDDARDVVVAGTIAYVARGGYGLEIVDISTPANPAEVSVFDTPGYAHRVSVSGTTACVADDSSLQVVDVAVSTAPELVGSFSDGGGMFGVASDQTYAYVACMDGGLKVFDLTRSGDFAYSYILSRDWEDPDETVEQADGRASFADVDNGEWWFNVRAVDGNGVWGEADHYHIFIDRSPRVESLTSPTHPDEWGWSSNTKPVFTWNGSLAPIGSLWTGANGVGVATSGDYAFVVDSGWYYGSRLEVLDVGDPGLPTSVASLDAPSGSNISSVAVQGAYAYVCAGGDQAGLWVVDVSDPLNPSYRGYCPLGGEANSVAVSGDLAYVADGSAGLSIVDISRPDTPAALATCDTPGEASRVTLSGTTAYVGDGSGGLQIVDVSFAGAPALVGSCATPDAAFGVAVVGRYAYVCCGYSGLAIIDVGTPASPTEAAVVLQNQHCVSASVSGGRLYVAGAFSGLGAYDISEPLSPVKVAGWMCYSDCFAVADGLVYAPEVWGNPFLVLEPFDWVYSWRFDQTPDTEPDTVAEGAAMSVTPENVLEGTSYFRVRAGDAQGNWSATQTWRVNIKTRGPITMAISYKAAKKGSGIWLQYSVTDSVKMISDWQENQPYVTIEIRDSKGVTLRTLDLGAKSLDTAFTAYVEGLPTGRYDYLVHATDWLGNPESVTGTASFTVK